MKIVKSNVGIDQIFDTNDISYVGYYKESTIDLRPFHHTHRHTDYEFLKQFFPENHSIFSDFGNSFFYLLQE